MINLCTIAGFTTLVKMKSINFYCERESIENGSAIILPWLAPSQNLKDYYEEHSKIENSSDWLKQYFEYFKLEMKDSDAQAALDVIQLLNSSEFTVNLVCNGEFEKSHLLVIGEELTTRGIPFNVVR